MMTIIKTSSGCELNLEMSIEYDIQDRDLKEAIKTYISDLEERIDELEDEHRSRSRHYG